MLSCLSLVSFILIQHLPYTSCLCKDAEDVQQNDWTAWPDHSKKKKKQRDEISSFHWC